MGDDVASRALVAILASALLGAPLHAYAQGASGPAPEAVAHAHIAEGTPIRVTLDEPLSSATASEGDEFGITTSEPIDLGNGVTLPAGFHGKGEVSNVERRGMLGRPGQLSVKLEYLRVGDTRIHLRANQNHEGHSTEGGAIALSLLVTPLFLGIIPLTNQPQAVVCRSRSKTDARRQLLEPDLPRRNEGA